MGFFFFSFGYFSFLFLGLCAAICRDFTEMEIACTRALSLPYLRYLRSSYTRSNLTLSNLLLLLFPQPQAHQRIPGLSGSKSADRMGAAPCCRGSKLGNGDEVRGVG